MKPQRRELKPEEVRCRPSPACPLQASCLRYLSPIPTHAAGIGNFRSNVNVWAGSGAMFCSYRIPLVADTPAAAPRPPAKPWPSST